MSLLSMCSIWDEIVCWEDDVFLFSWTEIILESSETMSLSDDERLSHLRWRSTKERFDFARLTSSSLLYHQHLASDEAFRVHIQFRCHLLDLCGLSSSDKNKSDNSSESSRKTIIILDQKFAQNLISETYLSCEWQKKRATCSNRAITQNFGTSKTYHMPHLILLRAKFSFKKIRIRRLTA
jgi:hypothetical protein